LREEPDRETLRRAAAADSSRRHVLFTRAVAGSGGWLLGVVAGGYIASVLPHHDCQRDDPGLDEALAGILIGGIAGAADGAAAPSLGRFRGYGGRFGRGLLGSTAGTVIAGALTLPTFAPAAIVAIPIGASSVAALAIGNC
jgi:hypothetical protein